MRASALSVAVLVALTLTAGAQPTDPMPPEVDAGVAGGSADPLAGSAGSADPDSSTAGSADPLAGSAGSADPDAGAGGQIIQLPTDVAAPHVTAAASPTVVRLGGTFTVIIRATYGEGVEVNLREPVDLGSVFEVRRKLSEDKQVSGGRTTREWQLEVTPWELGDLVMPPISVTYTAFGRAGQVQTNRVKLRILGVLGDLVDDPQAVRGNAPPAELSARDWFWLWVGGAAALVIGAAIGLVVYRRRRRRHVTDLVGGVVARPRRIDMTSQRALEQLLVIEQGGALDRDADRKTGYLEMADVLRDYLGARYHVPTAELTSSELLRRLAHVAPPEEQELVASWFERCDLVKYGGLRTTREEAHATLDDARALVITTTQLQATPRPRGATREAA
ncbi:MAG: BatD family protein [Myxococcota bacterium]|nr:BatD family protein [Myxococcota bacterium]